MHNYILILISVLLNASAQLFLKKGMSILGQVSVTPGELVSLIIKGATNIPILMGMLSYALSILLWMVVLSRVNVSFAYPFLSIGYIFTAVMAFFLFNEPLSLQKIAGILVICIGIGILSTSRA